MPLLGYDIDGQGGKLKINEFEANKVRAIYDLYLEKQSIMATIAELDQRGWTNKTWKTRKGTISSMPLSKGWLTVESAATLPLPDTSWMPSPLSRDSFMSWMSGRKTW